MLEQEKQSWTKAMIDLLLEAKHKLFLLLADINNRACF
jgi:hypothetical protein